MANIGEIESCYRYILGRDMNAEETARLGTEAETLQAIPVDDLRRSFLKSPEFHALHLETLFENLVPKSKVVAYDTELGFRIYLDLRQLHMSFGVLNEIYERHEVEILRQIMPEDGTFFDIGANCGYYSLCIATAPGFHGRVVAFEPLLPLHDLLRRAIADNALEDRITVHQLALGHAPCTLPLTDAESSINAGATELAVPGSPAPAGRRVVTVETLDRMAAGLRPDVLKIDIQGAEGMLFHGGAETIDAHHPTMLFEVCPEALHRVSQVRAVDLQRWLMGRGYRLWSLDENRLAPVAATRDLGSLVPETGLLNVLAVHDERMPDVRARLGGLPVQAAA